MRQGFSLVEVAILLLIAGGIAAASIMLGGAYLEGAEVRATRDNIKTVERAISAYALANKRLPCPADESISPSSPDYGKESASGAGCTALAAGTCCTAATTTSGEVKRGVLPFQTLGVSQSLAYDAWGNRLSYFVDRRMTGENGLETWPEQNTTIGDIIVQDLAGGMRTTKAVYALLSTGAKAHGSVNRTGAQQTLSDPSADELENVDVDAAGANPAPDKVLVQGMVGTGSDAKVFDDIVSYRLRSNLVTSNVNSIQNCPAGAHTWYENGWPCVAHHSDIVDGASVLLTDSVLQDTGSVTVSCAAGVLYNTNASCVHTPIDCSPGTVNWTVDATCAGTVGSTVLHGAAAGTITNTTGGRTGSANFVCDDGTYVAQAGATCGNNCAAGTANWTGTSNCTAPYGALTHGANSTIADSTAPGTGNVTITCSNGNPTQSAASCTPANCGGTTLYWGGSCWASVGAQSSGYSAGITNSAATHTGTATASCTDGAWSVTSPVCNARCNLPWGGSITHGGSVTAWNTAASCGGCASQTRTCSNGTLSGSYTAGSCNNSSCASCWGPSGWVAHGGWTLAYWAWTAPCGGTCWSEWRYCNNGSLSGSYGASSCSVAACSSCALPWGGSIAHGSSVTAWSTAASCGGCASETRTCTNGSLSGSYGFGACNNASCPGCPAMTVDNGIWPCCQTGVPASPNGTVLSYNPWDNAGGACGGGNHTGFGTITCSMGTWTASGACWFTGGDGG